MSSPAILDEDTDMATQPDTAAQIDAMPEIGTIVQITNEGHHWFAALIVVTEIKSFGVMGYAPMPHNDGSGTGCAYIRLRAGEFEVVGRVALVQS